MAHMRPTWLVESMNEMPKRGHSSQIRRHYQAAIVSLWMRWTPRASIWSAHFVRESPCQTMGSGIACYPS